MAATGYTPISLYYSATASNTPTSGNLVNGELAINIADGKLFYKDSVGVVQLLAQKGGGIGTSSNTQVLYNSGGSVAGSANLTFDGTTLTAAGLSGPLNGTVGATTANTGNFTTLTTSSTVTFNGGTANGVAYLNGSKVLTTGSALVFDGTNLGVGTSSPAALLDLYSAGNTTLRLSGSSGGGGSVSQIDFFRIGSNVTSSIVAIRDGGNTSGALTFYTAASGTNAEKMRLDSSGNLLVGTTTARAKITASGDLTATNGLSFVDTATTYANNDNYILFYNSTPAAIAAFSHPAANSLGVWGYDDIRFLTGATALEKMRLDASGNLGLGVTPSAWNSAYKVFQLGPTGVIFNTNVNTFLGDNVYINTGGNNTYIVSSYASLYKQNSGQHVWFNAPSGTAGNAITFTQAMTLDSSGNLLIGTSSTITANRKLQIVDGGVGVPAVFKQTNAATNECLDLWNNATAGNNVFVEFQTEATATARGTISFNRASVLISYNTTSDYRAKDILGPVQDSGATIDALKVYEGQMKGATQSRPMLVAHEAQAVTPYAVTGEKDAIKEDGTPDYQQIDVSSLVPLLIAEIQSLRIRIAQLEAKP